MIVGIILFINEVKLSIYRFLLSGDKKVEKWPHPVEFRFDPLTSCWTLNVQQVTVRS